jgi:hypothetical protein
MFYSTPSGGGRPPQQQLPPRPPPQEMPCPQAAPPPPPPDPNPNNGGKGKEKGKGMGKGKSNGFGGSSNNSGNKSRGAPSWPSYNSWTSTISMWPGMRPPPQQSLHPPQHTLLATPVYYGVPGGPSFTPLLAPPPHQQQAATPAWSSWMGTWDQWSLANSFSTMTLKSPAVIE